jgi:dTMP kinase
MNVDQPSGARRGRLFVFEGIDGSGKSTQLPRIAEALRARGYSVVELFEPTDGPYGRLIRERARGGPPLSPDEELDLFLRDRAENVERNIRPALARGDLILLDRYYFSTMAYQGARGFDPEAIRAQNEAFAPRPDLVLYFRIDVAAALERIHRARPHLTDHFERADFLERVAALFDDLARRLDYVRVIDAAQPPDAVTRQALDHIDECLRTRHPTPRPESQPE